MIDKDTNVRCNFCSAEGSSDVRLHRCSFCAAATKVRCVACSSSILCMIGGKIQIQTAGGKFGTVLDAGAALSITKAA